MPPLITQTADRDRVRQWLHARLKDAQREKDNATTAHAADLARCKIETLLAVYNPLIGLKALELAGK